jgi:MFS family permease
MFMPGRDLTVLALGQALSSTLVALLTTVSSLAGLWLAPHPALATLPVTATVAGTLAMIYPASLLMARLGRRGGFMLKAVLGGAGGAVCLAGLQARSFALLVAGTALLGFFNAFSQYYRFAALEAAGTPARRAPALAWVTSAGVVGGVSGPYLATHFPALGLSALYANAFVALLGLCALLGASQAWLSPQLGRQAATAVAAPPAAALLRRPGFLAASLMCAAGFAMMTLTMNAAPLAMQQCSLPLAVASVALQGHFAAMYLPSLFNPAIVRRLGATGLVWAGLALFAASFVTALAAPQTPAWFGIELALCGVGWNFMFNGGTLLLADTYSEPEKARAQGLNSLLVYSANLLASLAAGALLAYHDWRVVNALCLPLVLACALVLWRVQRRGTAQPV